MALVGAPRDGGAEMRDLGLPGTAFFFAVAGIGSLLVYLLIRAGTGRRDRIREWYANEVLPHYVRNIFAILPVTGLAGLDLSFLALLLDVPGAPDAVIVILLVAFALIMQASLIVAYRVPAPFLPPWLRAEIDAGITPVARPTRGDWILFAMFSILFSGTALALVVAVLPGLLMP